MSGSGGSLAILVGASVLLLMLLPLAALPNGGTGADATGVPSGTSRPTQTAPSSGESTLNDRFLVLESDGKTVSSIDARDFLIWTVAAEMPPGFEEEALKAQVVAAYTYFCYERATERAAPSEALAGADFADTPVPFPTGYTAAYWQERWGSEYDTCYRKIAAAVDAVGGKQICYDGAPIFAAYHAISHGQTEVPEVVWSAAFPYLQSVASPLDKNAPDYRTTVTLTAPQFVAAMEGVEGVDLSGDAASWIADDARTSAAGTVLSQTVGGVSLSGREWRTRCGLRSSCFTVAYADGQFTFTVKGYGHAVGMSQYGAEYLARSGYTWEDILHHYYTDITIT